MTYQRYMYMHMYMYMCMCMYCTYPDCTWHHCILDIVIHCIGVGTGGGERRSPRSQCILRSAAPKWNCFLRLCIVQYLWLGTYDMVWSDNLIHAYNIASSPGPTKNIGKGAWSYLQTFLYVLSQHVMWLLRAFYSTAVCFKALIWLVGLGFFRATAHMCI